ncbi:MAG: hypothetical protein PHX78_09580 [bacterium]|nr:hypothetical protein [bacterium]
MRKEKLNFKYIRENNPTEIINSDLVFKESLLNIISRIQSGKMKWHKMSAVKEAMIK